MIAGTRPPRARSHFYDDQAIERLTSTVTVALHYVTHLLEARENLFRVELIEPTEEDDPDHLLMDGKVWDIVTKNHSCVWCFLRAESLKVWRQKIVFKFWRQSVKLFKILAQKSKLSIFLWKSGIAALFSFLDKIAKLGISAWLFARSCCTLR